MPFAIGVTFFFLIVSVAAATGVAQASRGRGAPITVFVVLAVLAFWPVALAYHLGHSPKAIFRASVVRVYPLPNNYVRVFLSVSNVGQAAGQPMCVVSIQAKDGAGDIVGSGFDGMTGGQTVKAGKTFSGYMDIVVTNNAAHYVTSKSDVTVSGC